MREKGCDMTVITAEIPAPAKELAQARMELFQEEVSDLLARALTARSGHTDDTVYTDGTGTPGNTGNTDGTANTVYTDDIVYTLRSMGRNQSAPLAVLTAFFDEFGVCKLSSQDTALLVSYAQERTSILRGLVRMRKIHPLKECVEFRILSSVIGRQPMIALAIIREIMSTNVVVLPSHDEEKCYNELLALFSAMTNYAHDNTLPIDLLISVTVSQSERRPAREHNARLLNEVLPMFTSYVW